MAVSIFLQIRLARMYKYKTPLNPKYKIFYANSVTSKDGFDRFWRTTKDCTNFNETLTVKQVEFCRSNLELMPILKESALQTIEICKQKFKLHRWNCSTLENIQDLKKDLTRGKKKLLKTLFKTVGFYFRFKFSYSHNHFWLIKFTISLLTA